MRSTVMGVHGSGSFFGGCSHNRCAGRRALAEAQVRFGYRRAGGQKSQRIRQKFAVRGRGAQAVRSRCRAGYQTVHKTVSLPQAGAVELGCSVDAIRECIFRTGRCGSVSGRRGARVSSGERHACDGRSDRLLGQALREERLLPIFPGQGPIRPDLGRRRLCRSAIRPKPNGPMSSSCREVNPDRAGPVRARAQAVRQVGRRAKAGLAGLVTPARSDRSPARWPEAGLDFRRRTNLLYIGAPRREATQQISGQARVAWKSGRRKHLINHHCRGLQNQDVEAGSSNCLQTLTHWNRVSNASSSPQRGCVMVGSGEGP
jgi:hypothetical protein